MAGIDLVVQPEIPYMINAHIPLIDVEQEVLVVYLVFIHLLLMALFWDIFDILHSTVEMIMVKLKLEIVLIFTLTDLRRFLTGRVSLEYAHNKNLF